MRPSKIVAASDPLKAAWPAGLPFLGIAHGTNVGDPTSTLNVDVALNRKIRWGLSFLDDTSWTTVAAPTTGILAEYVGIRVNVTFTVPLLAASAGTLADVAAGTYDSYFTSAAVAIAAKFPSAIIRIGHEMNGNWYPWAAYGVETNYVSAWQRVVGLFRAQSATFKYLWSPDISYGRYYGTGFANPDDCYPGDTYVDYIGMSAYANWTDSGRAAGTTAVYPTGVPVPATNAAQRWLSDVIGAAYGVTTYTPGATSLRPYCLAWFVGFASAHAKPLIIAECGVGFDKYRNNRNVGDDGYYATKLISWAVANNVYLMNWYDKYADYNAGIGGNTFNCIWSQDQTLTGFAPPDATYAKPTVAAAILATFGG